MQRSLLLFNALTIKEGLKSEVFIVYGIIRSNEVSHTKGVIQKTNTGKIASQKQNPPGPPPPRCVLFCHTKNYPHFFVGKCIYNGQNKFYAWSHVKIFLFSSIIMVQFYHELTIIHGVIQ